MRPPQEAFDLPEDNLVTREVGVVELSLTSAAFVAPLQGSNDLATVGYRGPCPPRGHGRHRYRFRLHALAEELGLTPGAGVQELERAVSANVLAVAELVGIYER